MYPLYKDFIYKINYWVRKFIKDPNNIMIFFLGRFASVRLIMAYRDRIYETKEANSLPSFFPDLDIVSAVDSLKKDGIFVGLALPKNILQEILYYTESNDCYAGGDPRLGFRISDKKKVDQIYGQPFYIADYFNASEQCPAISKLANDSKLQEVANLYVGKRAKYTGCSLAWVFPVEGLSYDAHRQQSCNFHYDIDDYASMRVFFYLTELTTEGGPHVFVYGSHHRKSLFHVLNFWSRKLTDEAVLRFYGAENIFPIYGPAGFGFIEDTCGFHKGTVPKIQLRLMLMLHYANNNYNNGKYNDYSDPRLLKSFNQSEQPA